MQKQDGMNHGFIDEKTNTEMILVGKKGQKSRRSFEFKVLENIEKGDKTLFRFVDPADIRNTKLLTHEHKDRDDDQWIYLPALKRTKRIAAKNKSASFVGSEFSYEDMIPHDVQKYEHQLLREEACGENQCYVVESQPLFSYSGYSRIISWIRKDIVQTVRQDFYDKKKNQLLKKSKVIGLKKINGKFWRASEIHMINVQTKKETRLKNLSRSLANGFKESEFNKRALSR